MPTNEFSIRNLQQFSRRLVRSRGRHGCFTKHVAAQNPQPSKAEQSKAKQAKQTKAKQSKVETTAENKHVSDGHKYFKNVFFLMKDTTATTGHTVQ
jgi:hypothetical protein